MTDREELAMECDRLDKAGGNVRSFLRSLGYISPWGTWHRLQKEELHRDENKITEGKGQMEMGNLTVDQKRQVVDVAIGGGNPTDFLKSIGEQNPSASWYYIRKTLKYTDPERFALLNAKKEPKNEAIGSALTSTGQEKKPVTSKSARKDKKVPEEDEDIVTGIRTKCGEFRVSNGYLYFGGNTKGDELEMPIEEWLKFSVDLPRVMKKLGIA